MNCYWDKFNSPIGDIYIAAVDEGLVYCGNPREDGSTVFSWLNKYLPEYKLINDRNDIINSAISQLELYFAGKSKVLDMPLILIGTDFRKKVWQALQTIPYGETKTYGEIAKQVGNPKGPRAVGQANHHNPISYFVPWHRVIGVGGSLVGFGGGLDTKKWLLDLEGSNYKNKDWDLDN